MPTFDAPLPLPPWLVLAGLLGLISAAACYMLVGRHVSRLPGYALIGVLAASLGQVASGPLHVPRPLDIGDVNVAAASVAACGVLLVARLCGF